MTDDRIIDIFQEHGQYVTGKDYAMIRAIAEAVSPQRTWVGLTDEQRVLITKKYAHVAYFNVLDVINEVEAVLGIK